MTRLGHCQCPRDPDYGSCPLPPTAEDLLCDTCRRGCGRIVLKITGKDPIETNHIEIRWDELADVLGFGKAKP